jgi:hypothetical protein
MEPLRQIEAVELMSAMNNFTARYANALLVRGCRRYWPLRRLLRRPRQCGRPRAASGRCGVEPQIRPLAGKRPVEEGMDAPVNVLAQLGDLQLADHPTAPSPAPDRRASGSTRRRSRHTGSPRPAPSASSCEVRERAESSCLAAASGCAAAAARAGCRGCRRGSRCVSWSARRCTRSARRRSSPSMSVSITNCSTASTTARRKSPSPANRPAPISLRSSGLLACFRLKFGNSTLHLSRPGPMATSTTPQPYTADRAENSPTSVDANRVESANVDVFRFALDSPLEGSGFEPFGPSEGRRSVGVEERPRRGKTA